MSALTVGHVLMHCIKRASKNELRRIQVLLGEVMEFKHILYAACTSQEAQDWHAELPGPENSPLVQEEHVEAPGRLNVPLGQSTHVGWPNLLYSPALQGKHEDDAGGEKVPAAHGRHSDGDATEPTSWCALLEE